MSWSDRKKLYRNVEDVRKRPLIVYVTSKREGAHSQMSSDALPVIIEQLDTLPSDTKAIDFLIASYGGDPMVAWRIMTIIRQRVSDVAVLVPQSAYSSASLLAFGANEIIMHPNGHLGPVDMQITTAGGDGQPKSFSTEDITAFLEFVRDSLKITDQEHVRVLFELICKEVGSLGIGFTSRSSRLAVDLGERLLGMHMKDDESRTKLRSIVENMSRKFQSHAYPVNSKEAIDIGLPVNKSLTPELEKLMWAIWLDLENELEERVPFDPISELLRSPEGKKLLTQTQQWNMFIPPQLGVYWNTTPESMQQIPGDSINPINFSILMALVESNRIAHRYVVEGKILSRRNLDLVIQYNQLITTRKWHKA